MGNYDLATAERVPGGTGAILNFRQPTVTPGIPASTACLSPFTVGDWLVDPRTCRLRRPDRVRRLRPQLVDLLVCLAKRPGDLVLKGEIFAEVWPGLHIAGSGLPRCVAELRQALDDDARWPCYIEATRKRGYRLIAPVVWLAPASAAARRVGEAGTAGSAQADAPGQSDGSHGGRRGHRVGRRALASAFKLVTHQIAAVLPALFLRLPQEADAAARASNRSQPHGVCGGNTGVRKAAVEESRV